MLVRQEHQNVCNATWNFLIGTICKSCSGSQAHFKRTFRFFINLAFFENDGDSITSATRAADCALAMQAQARKLNELYRSQNRSPFAIRVGLATGYAKVGNIGPAEKIDYNPAENSCSSSDNHHGSCSIFQPSGSLSEQDEVQQQFQDQDQEQQQQAPG